MEPWKRPLMILGVLALLGGAAAVWLILPSKPRVVLYCAQDQAFATDLLADFQSQTGIAAAAKYDTEANKSVGLYQEIVQDRDRPRCDVFWNNEILSMIRLQRKGLLDPYDSPEARELEPFPKSARATDHSWHAFAARARILLINTRLLPREKWPRSLLDLTQEDYRGKVVMALPHHGTSATQAACLFEVLGIERAKQYYRELKSNEVQMAPGNKDVAVWVGQGRAPDGQPAVIGITDTDDALGEVRLDRNVAIVYPDREGSPEMPRMGTLYIPNTVGIIRGGPNPAAARRLVDYLLSRSTEIRLAESASGQIPFHPGVRDRIRPEIEIPPAVKVMEVDFARAADLWDEVQTFLRQEIVGP